MIALPTTGFFLEAAGSNPTIQLVLGFDQIPFVSISIWDQFATSTVELWICLLGLDMKDRYEKAPPHLP